MRFFSRLHAVLRNDQLTASLFALVLIVPLIFTVWFFEQFDTVKYVVFIIFAATALWYYSDLPKAGKLSKLPKLFYLFCLALLIWSVVSSVVSVDRVYSLMGFYFRFPNSLLFHLIWVIFLVCVIQIKDAGQNLLVKTLGVTAIANAVWGLMQGLGVGFYSLSPASGILRAPSFLGNVNFSALFVASISPILLYLAYKAKTSERILWFTGSMISLWYVVITGSRGAMLALFIGGIVVLLTLAFLPTGKLKVIKGLSAGVVLALVLIGLFINQVRPNWFKEDQNISSRFYMWNLSVESIIKKPIFGVGLGNFLHVFEQDRGSDFADEMSFFDDAHNLSLHWAVSGGIPLLFIFFGLELIGLISGIQSLRRGDLFASALICSLTIFMIGASFTPVSIPNYLLLGLILALLISLTPENKLSPQVNYRLPLKGLSVVLIIIGLCFFLSEALSNQGRLNYYSASFNAASQKLTWAHRLNPTNPTAVLFLAASQIRKHESSEVIGQTMRSIQQTHPKYARTSMWLGHLYALKFFNSNKKEDLDNSGTYFSKAVSQDVYSKYDRYLYIQYLVLANKLDEAEFESRKLLALNPSYLDAWLILAKVYQLKNNSQEFKKALYEAYRLNLDYIPLRVLWRSAKDAEDIREVKLDIVSLLGEI